MTKKAKATTARRWRQWSEAEAREAFDELAKTKETEAAFAQRKGFSTQRLQYWRKRVKAAPAAMPAFVAVTMPAATAQAAIEVRVGSVALMVSEGCAVEHAARLVEALARRLGAC